MIFHKITAKVNNYLSLVKFPHTIFALPFALLGFSLASIHSSESLSWKLLGLVLLCMLFARNAAMSFNRWADRDIDEINPRTAQREIPARLIGQRSALIFSTINALLLPCTSRLNNSIGVQPHKTVHGIIAFCAWPWSRTCTHWCFPRRNRNFQLDPSNYLIICTFLGLGFRYYLCSSG